MVEKTSFPRESFISDTACSASFAMLFGTLPVDVSRRHCSTIEFSEHVSVELEFEERLFVFLVH